MSETWELKLTVRLTTASLARYALQDSIKAGRAGFYISPIVILP